MPDARIIVAHALGPRFPELLVYDVLADPPGSWNRNVWVDLSFTGALYADSPYREQFAWSVRRMGTDRLLLGSDFPMETVERSLDSLPVLGFTPDEQRAIAYENAAKLFDVMGE